MDYYFAYQQADTLSKSLLDLHLKSGTPPVLNVKKTVIPAENLRIDSTLRRRPEQVAPAQEAGRQERTVQVQTEELLIDSSKFINPHEDVALDLKPLVIDKQIELPEQKINNTNYDWVTIILSFCLIILATIRTPYAKYIGHMFQSLVNYTTSVRMFRERNYSIVHAAFRLDIYFYITFSLFIYQALIYFEVPVPYSNFKLFLICISGVLGYFLIKRVLYSIVGFVNNGIEETNEYWYNLINYNRALGLFLFPIVVFVAFSPFFNPVFLMIIGLIITVIFYGMSLQRGILILLKKQFSIFYLFLYLCTLEILPLLLMFKMVLK